MQNKNKIGTRRKIKGERSFLNVKYLGVATLLSFFLSISTVTAQTMYVKENSGIQSDYTLSNIQKMNFSSGNITITNTDNSSNVYALSDLRYMSFTDFTVNIEEHQPDQSQRLNVYPSPASDVLNIDITGMDMVEGTLSILSVEGTIVLSRQINYAGVLSLDISHLPEGIYICRYNNTTEVKTVKIIIQ